MNISYVVSESLDNISTDYFGFSFLLFYLVYTDELECIFGIFRSIHCSQSIVMVKLERTSGILVHISSLPSPNGIGDIGEEAYKFVDFLHECNQQTWQVSCLEIFAGSHQLISV